MNNTILNKFLMFKFFLPYRWQWWIAAWLDVICGLLGIITLTYLRPTWDVDYRKWIIDKSTNKQLDDSGLDANGRPRRCFIDLSNHDYSIMLNKGVR